MSTICNDHALTQSSDRVLIELLFSQEDRLPRPAVDEILSRGAALTTALIATAIDPRNWNAPRPAWWAPVHATFILGSIDDPIGDPALFWAMRDAEAFAYDWISTAMPAILGRRGRRVRDGLCKIGADRSEGGGLRAVALQALAATTLEDAAEKDGAFALVGRVFCDASEERRLRGAAGKVLLDFHVGAYRDALDAFAREEHGRRYDTAIEVPRFSQDDVARAFARPGASDWYRRDWLSFYDAEQIAARQARWAREDGERASR